MEYYAQFQKICQIETRRWYVFIMGMVAVTYLMFQSSMLPYADTIKSLLPDDKAPFGVSNVVLSKDSSVESDSKGGINSARDINVFNSSDHLADDIFVFNSSDNGVKNPVEVHEVLSSDVGVDHEVEKSSKFNKNVELGRQNLGNSSTLEDVKERQHKDFPVLRKETKVTRVPRRNKVRPGMPPISVIPIDEMNRRLARHLASSSKMKPQWSSLRECDKEIVDAKVKIIDAPGSLNDKELYAPVFRNVSKFIRSYELMEKTLKVYVYKDGKKPIFHQPILKGLYASEGWFMKLMEGNKHFVVKDPEKAHLFYMPFSSRMLEYTLYVPGSHNRTKLRQFVKDYAETISAKYPFWNRTGGADHLAVACHDWALYETRHHMENSIKALCNADVTIGFKIGRDVSLPETYIRNARNPLRDRGGKPPSKRNILAFYAGNSHGYLRPTLLKHWKDKDPDIRVYGLLPTSVSKKLNYAQHMKSSKYCICPKGFEVNSPRVVESIFYECVPVIISDNFVPPLFDILNWEAFSVFVAEKDIPNLKNILMSIPEDKYLEMQLAVRRVQRHFLWHARPVKYDLFYMTLHSIWYSRVFQIQKPATGT